MSDPRASRWSYAEWAGPGAPAEFPTADEWALGHIYEVVREVRESLSSRPVPSNPGDIPPMPSTVADPTGIVREAWVKFHSAKERPVASIFKGADRAARHRPRPSRPRPGSEDPSALPEGLRR